MSMVSDVMSTERRQLEAFLVDNPDLQRLEDLLSEFNLFEAIGAQRQELRHSDFLRFLLDPQENHRLEGYFIKALLKRCLAGSTAQELGAIDIEVADFSDAIAERERYNIDILITSERSKIAVAIENEIDSAEHSDQLNVYARALDSAFPGHRKVLIFLTPDGDPPTSELWHPVSYETVMETVRAVRKARESTVEDAVLTTMRHYEVMLGRHIVSESETAKLHPTSRANQ